MTHPKGYFEDFRSSEAVSGIPGFKMNRPLPPTYVTGDVGIEIEVEGRGLPPCPTTTCKTTGGRWMPHADGSLRGEALEYVFDRPVSIDSVDSLVGGLYSSFKENKTVLTLSNRCSTHVHLNVSDWRVNHLSSFLALWAAIEPILIDWCGTERKTNHFCLGLEDTTATLDAWVDFLKTGVLHFREGLKYTALNPRHLLDFGSLEVRIAKGMEDPAPVIAWAKFLWAFRNYVLENFPNPASVPEYVSVRQPTGIIQDVCAFGNLEGFDRELLEAADEPNLRGFECFRDAQIICYAFPWDTWMPMITREYVPNPFGSETKRPSEIRTRPLGDDQLRRVATLDRALLRDIEIRG